MSRIFITGSTLGLGLNAAAELIAEGHEVVLHARTESKARSVKRLLPNATAVIVGELSSAVQTRQIADQVNALGRMDAVIHNAGVYLEPERGNTPEGHATTLAVNTLAPFILTALMERPDRLIYVSSSMHRGGEGSLADIDWRIRPWNASKAYSETKLHLAALAAWLSRHWPKVFVSAVDPGWVPTRMGGNAAPDDLQQGHQTQTWLASATDPRALQTGAYWHHKQRQTPAAEVSSTDFQANLIKVLTHLTGERLD